MTLLRAPLHAQPSCVIESDLKARAGARAGDRPIEMTLQRAWQALTWQQKARLGWEGLKLALSNLQVGAFTSFSGPQS